MPRFAVIVSALLASAGVYAEVRPAPTDGSDAVRAMHPATGGEYRVQYRLEREGAAAITLTLGLGADYDYEDGREGLVVRDYAGRRIYRVTAQHELINGSLYAQAWYRAAELDNRVRLAAALKSAGVSAAQVPDPAQAALVNDPYWNESELGLLHPKLPRPKLERGDDGGRASWRYAGEEVVAVRYAPERVPAAVRGGLRRLWPQIARMHPAIVDALVAEGRLPQELWVREVAHPQLALATTHWVRTGAEWIAAAPYPLTAGLPAVPPSSAGAFPAIWATLLDDVAERRVPPAQSVYAERAQAALGRNAAVEAYLWVIEMTLAQAVQGGCTADDTRAPCVLSRQIGPALKADPRVDIVSSAKAPDSAQRARFGDVPNAYMLRLLWATRPPARDVPAEVPEQDLLEALQASPVANFAKDAGDYYAARWRPYEAWAAWDLGRRMAGHRDGDLLSAIDHLEGDLEQNLPELFERR